MIRPGVTSRRSASWSRVSHSALTAPRPRRPRTRCMPEVRRHASTRGVASKLSRFSNSWRAHSSLPASTSWAASASRSSTSTSTSRAAYSSHGSGSGRFDQSTAECSFFIRCAEHGLDQRGQPDARVAEQPAGQLGVEQRARRSPTSARQGRSWVAACRIHSVPSSAAASGASDSNAIGSTSQVPAPSRRSWIRYARLE